MRWIAMEAPSLIRGTYYAAMAGPPVIAFAKLVPTLESTRLRLRPYRDSDVDRMFQLYSDPLVMRYWSFPPWTHRAQAEAYVQRALNEMAEGRTLPWAVATRADDRLVGTTTMFALDTLQGRAEIGYSLDPKLQGQGLASEALRLALVHAFDTLRLRRVEADVDPRNIPSCRLLERLGFRLEGLLRARWRVAGEICDTAMYGLLAPEFIREPRPRDNAVAAP
jgi:RimJ/RimL family protein N-acetyltransferase